MFIKILLAAGLLLAPLGWDYDGHLHGGDTVDYVYFSATQGETVDYSAKASGRGSNKLTVRVQQKRASGSWRTIDTLIVPVDSTRSDRFTVRNYRDGSTERLRYKLSRKIFSKGIDWFVDDSL